MLINASELVVGDIVKLSTGDKTPGKFYNIKKNIIIL
jgi:magnesium-transporting ATPase (P-type)